MAMNLQQRVHAIGLVGGPVLALLAYFALPVEYADVAGKAVPLGHATRATLAMMVWMATWWLTEAVEIEVTSLLPIVAFPLLGIMPLGKTTANYGADVIYLFLGGFVLALAIQRWGLDRRIAFQALKWVGTRPAAIVAGVMGATAFVSMWVSNTATAAMMVPIALSIVDLSLFRRTGKTLLEHGGIPQDDVDDRTWRCRCCWASPMRRRSADWARSSGPRPTASSSGSSSRPTASKYPSCGGCWWGFLRCCSSCRSRGSSTPGCSSRPGSARSRAGGLGCAKRSASSVH
jgi:hypothetical protein